MTRRPNGATRIFLYNWPAYAVTWAASLAAAMVASRVGGIAGWLLGAGAATSMLWSGVSLAVAHYVYDRSPLAGASWVAALVPKGAKTWASVDAGLDAEVVLDDAMPERCVARLDVYDPVAMRAPSVRRARRWTPRTQAATRSSPVSLALAPASCDVVAVVFTAHELRASALRERFFAELRRVLSEGGRVVLVEHVRDAANFAAFGPGFLHFLPRREWLRLARIAGLRVAAEARVTPWVRAFALEKAG